jgi:hypothetical protein
VIGVRAKREWRISLTALLARTPAGPQNIRVLAADLDGDGRREVVAGFS